MRVADEVVKFIVDKLVRMILADQPKARAPEPDWDFDPPPPKRIKSKYPAGSMKWFKTLPPPARDERDITMNSLAAREAPKRRLPRRPGMQVRHYNGSWWYY